jgi:hypothetical protein
MGALSLSGPKPRDFKAQRIFLATHFLQTAARSTFSVATPHVFAT